MSHERIKEIGARPDGVTFVACRETQETSVYWDGAIVATWHQKDELRTEEMTIDWDEIRTVRGKGLIADETAATDNGDNALQHPNPDHLRLRVPSIRPFLPVVEHPLDTIADEQERLVLDQQRGSDCRCCGQRVQIYRRTIYGQMAVWLLQLVKATRFEQNHYSWTDVGQLAARGGDYAKLVYWNLVEQHPDPVEDKRTSGLWRPTADGVRFARRETFVPRYAYTYNQKLIGLGGEPWTIDEALGKKFVYDEIMGGARW